MDAYKEKEKEKDKEKDKDKYGFLTNESTNQNRLITICNWECYQSNEVIVNKGINRRLTND